MNKLKTYFYKRIFLATLLGTLLWACSTQKEAWLNRKYHDMTAHYNGYFNAKEIIKESRRSYLEGYKEDYTRILPVYRYPTNVDVEPLRQPMETAIEKTSNVIAKNAMPNPEKKQGKKREEWCKWIDDNWFVMGQANFHKLDFKNAEEIFKFVKKNYPSQQIIYRADLWLAKTAIEKGDYATALSTLELLRTGMEGDRNTSKEEREGSVRKPPSGYKEYDISRPVGKYTPLPRFPKHFEGELYTVYAHLLVKKGDYKEALEKIDLAIKHQRSKKMRTRLTFIAAQLNEKTGNKRQARQYYNEVTKMTAPYEMEFYAEIYGALLFDGGNTKGLRSQLLKMAKDEKNKDYLDQIYYVLAELDFAENDKEHAIAYLKQSAKYSTVNTVQKAKTYTRLGDVLYEDKLYPEAKQYYDSSLTVIDESYPDYSNIVDRSEGLNVLVTNLDTYTFQDSVLNLALCGNSCIDKAIEERIRLKKEADQQAFEDRQNNPSTGGSGFEDNYGSGARWYFYNQDAIAFGITEFKKVWGDRKLEDNWRRSNRNTVNFNNQDREEGDSLAVVENDPYAPEFYLKNLPLTEEAQGEANKKIANALYNLGMIYRQKLNESEISQKYFDELIDRYGESELALPGYYQLYLLHKENNQALANKYKKIILEDFPDSEYARILINPDFNKEEELARQKHSAEYAQVYERYQKGRYQDVLAETDQVLTRQENNSFIPKYLLLKAYALGEINTEDKDKIQETLEKLATGYPDTKEGKMATAILERMKNQNSVKNVSAGTSNFIYNSNMEHYFVLIYPTASGSINPVKKAISNYNSTAFQSRNLSVSSSFIDKENYIVYVKPFPNKAKALQYLQSFKANNGELKPYNQDLTYFVITHQNYATFLSEKNLDAYLQFYEKNY